MASNQRLARRYAGRQAQIILSGPQYITLSGATGKTSFYGWPMLSLKITTPTLPSRVESRSVYANLVDEDQQFAILRVVYWDWEISKQAISESGKNSQQIFPARFIKLPINQLEEWLFGFTYIKGISINELCEQNDEIPIRGLRIELDYTACIFEKVWQIQDEDYTLLNQKWDQVWQQMTEFLITEPIVTNVDEDFWVMKSKIIYDFQTYQPSEFGLK